jgi:hypothetical protein
VPINDDNRDDNAGAARAGGQGVIGETPGELIDAEAQHGMQPTAR